MSRPKKWRRVCFLPDVVRFVPCLAPNVDGDGGLSDTSAEAGCAPGFKPEPGVVQLTVDEYDVIRLKDYEGLNQNEIARRMGVGHSTVQRVYDRARRKLAEFLVTGRCLSISGGDYRLCESGNRCSRPCARTSPSFETSGEPALREPERAAESARPCSARETVGER